MYMERCKPLLHHYGTGRSLYKISEKQKQLLSPFANKKDSLLTLLHYPLASLKCPEVAGVLRVEGRLNKAAIPEGIKHPLILSKDQHISDLLLRHIHLQFGHGGRKEKLLDHEWTLRSKEYHFKMPHLQAAWRNYCRAKNGPPTRRESCTWFTTISQRYSSSIWTFRKERP